MCLGEHGGFGLLKGFRKCQVFCYPSIVERQLERETSSRSIGNLTVLDACWNGLSHVFFWPAPYGFI